MLIDCYPPVQPSVSLCNWEEFSWLAPNLLYWDVAFFTFFLAVRVFLCWRCVVLVVWMSANDGWQDCATYGWWGVVDRVSADVTKEFKVTNHFSFTNNFPCANQQQQVRGSHVPIWFTYFIFAPRFLVVLLLLHFPPFCIHSSHLRFWSLSVVFSSYFFLIRFDVFLINLLTISLANKLFFSAPSLPFINLRLARKRSTNRLIQNVVSSSKITHFGSYTVGGGRKPPPGQHVVTNASLFRCFLLSLLSLSFEVQ